MASIFVAGNIPISIARGDRQRWLELSSYWAAVNFVDVWPGNNTDHRQLMEIAIM